MATTQAVHPEPSIRLGDVTVRCGTVDDADAVLAYYERNRQHLERTSPRRPPAFYTLPFWHEQLEAARQGYQSDRLLQCFLFPHADKRVVGVVNLSNFVRGAFQACHLGYSIDQELQGTGRMRDAVEALVTFAFSSLSMHRVMANYLVDNERSARLLAKLGFEREGFAKNYLLIAGQWRDHILTSKVNHAWGSPGSR